MFRVFLTAALLLPGVAYAVGGGDSSPPEPTETTEACEDGLIRDEDSGKCVPPDNARLDDAERYRAVREFAYAGRYQAALATLAAMPEDDDRRLTYLGFVNRKLGNQQVAMHHYLEAIGRNPDNILARSYMGQGLAEAGHIAPARAQLAEIRTRGGRGSWAETALVEAIETGTGASY